MDTRTEWTDIFLKIKKIHDEVYYTIDGAIKLEEKENPQEALQKYRSSIHLIDEVLSIQVEYPNENEDSWQQACSMIDKLKQTRVEVLLRINAIQSSRSYFFSVSQHRPIQIIYSQNNIQLYFISHDGNVTTSRDPSILNICFIEGNESSAALAFLQIDNWVYPLITSISPSYRKEYGAFIFPDITSTSGAAVGLKFPIDVDDSEFSQILETLLNKTSLVQSDVEKQRRGSHGISDTISDTTRTGAFYISQGLVKVAEKTGQLLNYGTPKLLNHISSTENPEPVSEGLIKTVQFARNASGTAVNATSYIAEKVGSATAALGHYLAPLIHKHGTKLLSYGFNTTEQEAQESMNSVFTVTTSTVEGIATVYSGLQESAQILGRNLANNTVKIVEHKYGESMAGVTDNTLYTVGNIYTASNNLNCLKPKGLIKQTAKEASKAVVHDSTLKTSDMEAVIYPDLSEFQKEISNN